MNCKIWCVRAEGGKYADCFWEGGYVAIGKDVAEPYPLNGSLEDCKKLYRQYNKTQAASEISIRQHASYMKQFRQDINTGDYVITPAKDGVLYYGIVEEGPYRFELDPSDTCPHMHRLPVKWKGELLRKKLATPLRNRLGNPPTVFNVRYVDEFTAAISAMEN